MEKCDQCGAEGQGLTMQHATNCPKQQRGVWEPARKNDPKQLVAKQLVTNSAKPAVQTTPLKFNPQSGAKIIGKTPLAADGWRRVQPFGTNWDYNPWTGDPRRIEDIADDPVGLLIVPPSEAVLSAIDEATVTTSGGEVWRRVKFGKPMGGEVVDVIYKDGSQTRGIVAGCVFWDDIEHWRLSDLPTIGADTALAISEVKPIAEDSQPAPDLFKNMSVDDPRYVLNNYVEEMLDGNNEPGMQQDTEKLLVKAGLASDIAIRVATKIGMQDDETRLRGQRGASLLAAESTLLRMGYTYIMGDWRMLEQAHAQSAPDLLDAASGHMRDRAAQYDKPEGERSMQATVDAFNAVTGRAASTRDKVLSEVGCAIGLASAATEKQPSIAAVHLRDTLVKAHALLSAMRSVELRESEGWLLMALLKMVRSETTEAPHRDSVEDLIAYAGLYGEARIGGK